MSKLNWDRTTWENRIAVSGSESVKDWDEEPTKPKGRKQKLPEGWTKCSICKAEMKSESLGSHDRKVHGIKDRQQLIDAGILPTNKFKIRYGQWPVSVGGSFKDIFTVEIVDNDPTWERQGFVAFQISSIAPRIMLRHKSRSFMKTSIRCTLICYSDDPIALEIARELVKELASMVALNIRIEAKKPKNSSDLVIHF